MAAPPKPPHGSPCNGCGQCCEAELCPLAAALYRRWEGPCPALTPVADGPKVCGLVTDPGVHFPARVRRWGAFEVRRTAAILIGAGIGCDAQVEDEPRDPAFCERMLAHRASMASAIRQACIVWGIRID